MDKELLEQVRKSLEDAAIKEWEKAFEDMVTNGAGYIKHENNKAKHVPYSSVIDWNPGA